MRTVAKISLILAALLLVASTFTQTLALCGALFITSTPAAVFTDVPWLVPLLVTAIVLLPVSFVLCIVLREKGNWLLLPLGLAAIGAVLALITALALKEGLPPTMDVLGETRGLTTVKLWTRHLTSVIAGGLTVMAAFCHLLACRKEKRQKEEAGYKPVYNLDGKPLFKDRGSTIGLDGEDASRPLKRSQRQALKKQQEKAAKAKTKKD